MSITYMDFLEEVQHDDLGELREKDALYGGSWLKRGGVGAFMMLARKWDRLEQIMKSGGYDIIGLSMAEGAAGREGSILDQVGDLRRYLLLVEAELRRLADERHGRGPAPIPDYMQTHRTGPTADYLADHEEPRPRLTEPVPLLPILLDVSQYEELSDEDQRKYAVLTLPRATVALLAGSHGRDRKFPPFECNSHELTQMPELQTSLYYWVEAENKWRMNSSARSWIERA